MNVAALIMLIALGLTATAAAEGTQGTPSGHAASPGGGGSPKAQLSEVRTLAHELQGHTEKLRELLEQHRSLVEKRPQPQGSGAEGKQSSEEALAKWNAALERLLRRIDEARAAVVEAKQRLEQAATGQLPTALAKDVANARNEADAERANAEQVLKTKPAPARPPPRAKKPSASEKAPPPIPDDL